MANILYQNQFLRVEIEPFETNYGLHTNDYVMNNDNVFIINSDIKGNIKRVFTNVFHQIHCHTEFVTAEVRQNAPGLREDAEYVMYLPAYDLKVLDKLELDSFGRILKLKVIAVDFVTFPGVAVVQATTETR